MKAAFYYLYCWKANLYHNVHNCLVQQTGGPDPNEELGGL